MGKGKQPGHQDRGCNQSNHRKLPKELRLFFSLASERDIARGSMNMKHRTAAVEAAFGKGLTRTNVARAGDLQLRKIAADAFTACNFHSCANCHPEIVRNID